MSENKPMESSDISVRVWSILVGILAFYITYLIIVPKSFGLFLLYLLIGSFIYNRITYWVARLMLFINDLRE